MKTLGFGALALVLGGSALYAQEPSSYARNGYYAAGERVEVPAGVTGDVVIAGEIRQPLNIVAERLEVLATARILAPVTYEGATPATVAPGALVTSPIAYKNIPARDARAARSPSGLSSVLLTIHLFVGGVLLLLLVPRFAAAPAEMLRAQPVIGGGVVFMSILFGLGALGLWTYRTHTRAAAGEPIAA